MTAPSISSVDLRDTIAGYTQRYVESSSEVEPLTGDLINPGERCKLRLTATNDPHFPTGAPGGVRLINVRWHVRVINTTVVDIVVPPRPLDARDGPTDNLPLLTPGDSVPELYVFPRHGKSVLDPGETNSIELEGNALAAGTILVMFNLVADVDAYQLDLVDQANSPLAALGTTSVVT
jgi:hypothetical protein